jgi:hypothetical protein
VNRMTDSDSEIGRHRCDAKEGATCAIFLLAVALRGSGLIVLLAFAVMVCVRGSVMRRRATVMLTIVLFGMRKCDPVMVSGEAWQGRGPAEGQG